MKNVNFGWTLLLTCGLALCAVSATGSASQSSTDDVETIQFFNSKAFDKKLSAAFSDKLPTVTVTFPVPFTTNEIPERIDKWLVVIEDYEGTIELKQEPQAETERGLFFDALVPLLKRIYEEFKEKMLYRPAQNYNVTIYYMPKTAVVTRFVFSIKTPKAE